MNERTLKALVEADAVKAMHIVANGARFHIEAETRTGRVVVSTMRGGPRTWGGIDSAARWVHRIGVGLVRLDISQWQPGQRALRT